MDANTLYERPMLSKLAVKLKNRKYIAEEVLKKVVVSHEKISYLDWDRGVTFRRQNTKYGELASANVIDLKATKKTHDLTDRGLATWVTQKEKKYAGEAAARSSKVKATVNGMQLDLECELATKLRATGTYPAGNSTTLAGAAQWSHADGDPKKEILTRNASLIVPGNVLVFGKQAYDAVQLNKQVIEAVKYSQGAVDTREILAKYFQVSRILVGEAFEETAKEGQADSAALSYIWGKDVMLLHIPEGEPDPLMEEPSFGYLPVLGENGAEMWKVFGKQPDPERGTGAGAEYLKVDACYDPLITASALGFLWKEAVA